MATEKTEAIECEVHIAARPETVFSYFIDPAKMVLWKGMEAQLEPQPGGVYRVNVTGRDIARGTYREIEPYTRVVFTWGWEGESSPIPPGSSTVEITLTPDAAGTRVHLRHYGLPVEAQGQHAEGWEHYLARLAMSAAGVDPGVDPWVNVPPAQHGM